MKEESLYEFWSNFKPTLQVMLILKRQKDCLQRSHWRPSQAQRRLQIFIRKIKDQGHKSDSTQWRQTEATSKLRSERLKTKKRSSAEQKKCSTFVCSTAVFRETWRSGRVRAYVYSMEGNRSKQLNKTKSLPVRNITLGNAFFYK